MKVQLVRRGYSATGGAEAYLLRLAGALHDMGHDVELVAAGWPPERWPFGKIIQLPAKTPREFANQVAQLRREPGGVMLSLERTPGCDVFRAGDGVHAAWLARRAAFEPSWKRIFRQIQPKHRSILLLERAVFDPKNTRAIIANSEMVIREIQAHFSFPKEKIYLVRNGFDLPRAPASSTERTEAKKHLGFVAGEFVALFVGSGWERKGLKFAIRACERAGCKLLVAGRGPQHKYRSSCVRHMGAVQDLRTIWAAADVLLQPTWYDPFSNACLEGLAAGLPVITTRDNGFGELLDLGKSGSVVGRADSVEELADAIAYWRESLSTNARNIREFCHQQAGKWTTDRNVHETLRVLEKAKIP